MYLQRCFGSAFPPSDSIRPGWLVQLGCVSRTCWCSDNSIQLTYTQGKKQCVFACGNFWASRRSTAPLLSVLEFSFSAETRMFTWKLMRGMIGPGLLGTMAGIRNIRNIHSLEGTTLRKDPGHLAQNQEVLPPKATLQGTRCP